MKAKLKRAWKVLNSYIPKQLPQSEAAAQAWCTEVLEVAGLPDNASFRIAIYSMVLHLSSKATKASQQGFIQQLRRSIANQSCYNLMDELKRQEKQKEADEQRVKETAETVVS
jgi:hypothetical protein